jgi:hypothetical protein
MTIFNDLGDCYGKLESPIEGLLFEFDKIVSDLLESSIIDRELFWLHGDDFNAKLKAELEKKLIEFKTDFFGTKQEDIMMLYKKLLTKCLRSCKKLLENTKFRHKNIDSVLEYISIIFTEFADTHLTEFLESDSLFNEIEELTESSDRGVENNLIITKRWRFKPLSIEHVIEKVKSNSEISEEDFLLIFKSVYCELKKEFDDELEIMEFVLGYKDQSRLYQLVLSRENQTLSQEEKSSLLNFIRQFYCEPEAIRVETASRIDETCEDENTGIVVGTSPTALEMQEISDDVVKEVIATTIEIEVDLSTVAQFLLNDSLDLIRDKSQIMDAFRLIVDELRALYFRKLKFLVHEKIFKSKIDKKRVDNLMYVRNHGYNLNANELELVRQYLAENIMTNYPPRLECELSQVIGYREEIRARVDELIQEINGLAGYIPSNK